MNYTVTAIVHENSQAQTIIETLHRSGIERERVHITTDDAVVKLRSDGVGAWSVGGLVVGVVVGGLVGWMVMPSGVLGIVGALWCAVIGAIIGGRALGYAAFDRVAPAHRDLPKVIVSVDAENRSDVEHITSALNSGGAERIAWIENRG